MSVSMRDRAGVPALRLRGDAFRRDRVRRVVAFVLALSHIIHTSLLCFINR